jgi:transposase
MRRERRRRWSPEEKLQIVRETLRPGAVASVVAEQHGIGTGQLYTWRKQMLTGFAAVELASELQPPPLLAAPAEQAGDPVACAMDVAVEVQLPDGTRVRVGKGAPAALLSDVFAALDRR